MTSGMEMSSLNVWMFSVTEQNILIMFLIKHNIVNSTLLLFIWLLLILFISSCYRCCFFPPLSSRWLSPNHQSNNHFCIHVWSKPARHPEGSCYLSKPNLCRTLMTEVNNFALIILWLQSCTNQCLCHQSIQWINMWKMKSEVTTYIF